MKKYNCPVGVASREFSESRVEQNQPMKAYTDMRVAQLCLDELLPPGEEWESETVEALWEELKSGERYCFDHAREAELIFYVGGFAEGDDQIELETDDFPVCLLEQAKLAANDGFTYLCVYCG